MSHRWIVWGVPAGAGILLAAALVVKQEPGAPAGGRPPQRPPVPERQIYRGTEAPASQKGISPRAELPPAVDASRLQQDSWPATRERLEKLSRGAVSPHAAVLQETGRFLEFDASTLEAFDAVRLGVQADLERIQGRIGRELSSYPVDLPDEDLRRLQEGVVQRSQGERRAALSRLEAFLDGRDNHQQFRGFLETWVLEIARMDP